MSLTPPDFLRPLLARSVAVFGAGVSGRAVLSLLGKLGSQGVIYDEKAGEGGAVNNFTPSVTYKSRLVVYSPGFAADHPWLQAARAAGLECLGELDFASLFWSGPILAVTGTNGKTTLTEFLTHALRVAGVDARATGNIGLPFSQLVAETDGGTAEMVAVCEVSSFQAESLRHFHADATLWTNFAEDHLERHAGMKDYFAAKWTLIERTAPGAVFAGTSVQHYAAKFGRALPASARIISEVKTPDPRLAGGVFAHYPQSENYLLAAAWWRHAGRPEDELLATTRTFRLGPHRLACVGNIQGVSYWNDSKATNFHAVEAALAGFAAPVLLIAGGKAKGGDLAGFVRRIAPGVRELFLLGETKQVLASLCVAQRIPHRVCEGLADAVHQATEAARPGDHVLLSPGFDSFDLFLNYQDRGNQFEAIVNNLGVSPTLR